VAAAFLVAMVGFARVADAAATITVVNLDDPNEGFNDTTPAAPVGGNSGTTLGAQRLIAFQFAADLWGTLLSSDVEIRVAAEFNPLFCDADEAVLGQAGAEAVYADFDGAPEAATYYAEALADRLAGLDFYPPGADIGAEFNSSFGTTCDFPDGWYYGLDASPPGFDVDFVTTVLHELAHGLGFFTLVTASGAKFLGDDDVFMLSLEDHSAGLLWPEMTNGERRNSSRDTGDLHWVGPEVVAASGDLAIGADPNSGHVEMYAPSPYDDGSSVSHFSDALFPHELMEPFDTGPIHDVGLSMELLSDLGWTFDCGNGVVNGGEECDDGNTSDGDGCSASCQLEPPPQYLESKDQQSCINELNKALAKVAKTYGKHIDRCIKEGSRSRLPAGNIENCVVETGTFGKDKVQDAKDKTLDKAGPNGKCPPAAEPDFGATDANTVNQVALAKELSLIQAVFGSDLDAAIISEVDNKDGSKCQQGVAKAAKKCQGAKLKAFNGCKKSGLSAKSSSRIVNAPGLEGCLSGRGDSIAADMKGKVEKACDPATGKIKTTIDKKCAADLGAFAGCNDPNGPLPTAGELASCIDQLVECEVCLALNAADGLDHDCDLFDDGQANGSCP
jgi:cysteine-rich repeat protein